MNSSVPERRVAQVRGATLTGLTATLIDVRATIDPAQRGFEIAGVPGHDTWTLRDRVRATVLNRAMVRTGPVDGRPNARGEADADLGRRSQRGRGAIVLHLCRTSRGNLLVLPPDQD